MNMHELVECSVANENYLVALLFYCFRFCVINKHGGSVGCRRLKAQLPHANTQPLSTHYGSNSICKDKQTNGQTPNLVNFSLPVGHQKAIILTIFLIIN